MLIRNPLFQNKNRSCGISVLMEPAIKVKCWGEAHSNIYIDHCGVCMPHWGEWWACPDDGTKLKGNKCPNCHKKFLLKEPDAE